MKLLPSYGEEVLEFDESQPVRVVGEVGGGSYDLECRIVRSTNEELILRGDGTEGAAEFRSRPRHKWLKRTNS